MEAVEQPVRALQINIGGQLAPDEIIGRDHTVARMFDYLERGMNLVINDPRRIGKSATLSLLASASTKKTTVLMTSVQPVQTIDELLLHLVGVLHGHQSLSRRARKRVSEFVEATKIQTEVDGVPFAVSVKTRHSHKTPLQLLNEIVAAVNDSLDEDELLVLAIDEFTEAVINIATNVDGRAEATQLLQTLQSLRKQCGRVRWVLTGSIGMHHAIRWTECTAAVVSGDCKNVQVGPLNAVDAEYLSRCLALGEGIELTNDAHACLADESDGIPILIHAIVDDLRLQALAGKSSGAQFDAGAVQEAIKRYISDNDESRAFEHFVARLETYYAGDELAIARSLLDETSTRTKPAKASKLTSKISEALEADPEQVRGVLSMIVDDHYLRLDEGRLHWRYPVLARVWRAKRQLG